jgi:hypothetical protein
MKLAELLIKSQGGLSEGNRSFPQGATRKKLDFAGSAV